jgi:hypothetical protein
MHLRTDFVIAALLQPLGSNHKISGAQALAYGGYACAANGSLLVLLRLLGFLPATVLRLRHK